LLDKILTISQQLWDVRGYRRIGKLASKISRKVVCRSFLWGMLLCSIPKYEELVKANK
jgi:hypothetical protein